MSVAAHDHAGLMDAVYRHQRHIYDATRKYYLLGRDQMIADLAVPEGGRVLEVGCGTGRNLALMARRYPTVQLVGIDISRAMLDTASARLARAGLGDRVDLVGGDASRLDALGLGRFDRVVFSYTLSMIPDWRRALAQGTAALAPGGSVQAVDFGHMQDLPRLARVLIRAWLARFHVSPRDDLPAVLNGLAARRGARSETRAICRSYACRGGIILPSPRA